MFSDKIYQIDYEQLVGDHVNEIRNLMQYLEIEFEDACLEPHKNQRAVRTASQRQVKEPIYSKSSEAWRKYETFLNGKLNPL